MCVKMEKALMGGQGIEKAESKLGGAGSGGVEGQLMQREIVKKQA